MCVVTIPKRTENKLNFNHESEVYPMKKYDVTMTGRYKKTMSIYADSLEQATENVKTVLFDTNLICFSSEDFVDGKVTITDADQSRCEENDTGDECMENEDCSDCPHFCPVCGACLYENED